MKEFILTVLGSSGLTIIITASVLLRPFREFFNKDKKVFRFLYKLFTCSMCTGLYVGAIVTVIRFFCPLIVFEIITYAGAVSLFAFFAHKSMEQNKRPF